jgi:RND superfamily putative drug exporter
MQALSRFVLGHRLLVRLFWLVVFAAGAATADRVSGRLSQDFATPGAASYPVNQAILHSYGTGGDGYPEAVVITLPAGTTVDTPESGSALRRAFDQLAADPGLRVVSYANTGNRRLVSADGRTTLALVFTPHHSELAATNAGPRITALLAPALSPGSTCRRRG